MAPLIPDARQFAVAAAYGLLLMGLHLIITKGTGSISSEAKHVLGADAATTFTRPWAYLTSQFTHNTWGHLGYNVTVMMATLPFALQAYGVRTLAFIVLASVVAAFLVNMVLVAPLRAHWEPAVFVHAGRLVGSSIAIFAGAGLAWSAWDGATWAKGAVLAGYVAYELALVLLAVTGPFVGIYHVVGAGLGAALGLALRTLR